MPDCSIALRVLLAALALLPLPLSAATEIHIADSERHRSIDSGSWFWIEGVREELDQPGEWFLRRSFDLPPEASTVQVTGDATAAVAVLFLRGGVAGD